MAAEPAGVPSSVGNRGNARFYPAGRYDLAGFCVAVVEESELIDGHTITPGMP